MNQVKKANYHHGNLRQALLETALEALASESLDKLSLRGLAKTLGVTPTAVYGHFSDKTALLMELRTLGFAQLSDTMAESLEALPANSRAEDKVKALGHAYMHFALEKPHLFDTLFSWNPDFERITPECIEAGVCSESMLRDTLIELIREQGAEATEYQASVASFSAWSLVHGISTLLKTGSVEGAIYCDNWPETFSSRHPESQARVIDHLLTIEIEGLKVAVTKCQEAD
ncbi:TetR/AcrR family transcriptional regulator [Marinimicrobium sp. ABcell2]|uniref:TetR/AcrR family transcriptional regulator n=1 Tax=Marinimicrobium sp. ABcell2 TaxID=3069751 RepID=UPI0027AF9D95|nr:TetR/AcrR family transcriptional regulator [Marinimicrobium sp. ABcell2]MDQ2078004.1 TetR/AcrR family transcriptional regulator [Marinimicrobium sp. ABcell2]